MIKSITKKVYLWYLGCGILYFTIGFLFAERNLDLNIHDVYLVISYRHIGAIILSVHVFLALVYYLIRKYSNFYLTLVHFFLTIPVFGGLYLGPYFLDTALSGTVRRY